MTEREQVRAFHVATGQPVCERPELPAEPELVLRCRLLLEETLEYINASGCAVHVVGLGYITRERVGVITTHAPDLAAMAQENADVRYVSHGNDITMGAPPAVFAEVHRANMAKASGGRRADGKVMKPEGWRPPNVAGVLAGTVCLGCGHPLHAGRVCNHYIAPYGAGDLCGCGSATACNRVECRPFGINPCGCSCQCHEGAP